MKKRITIQESDWEFSIESSREWENYVQILVWEHDYENKRYIIDYKHKE